VTSSPCFSVSQGAVTVRYTNRYTLTEDGIRIAVFYTKIYNRLLVPLTATNQPQAPPELRAALAAITRHVDDYADRARLPRRVKLDTNVYKLTTKVVIVWQY